MKRFLWLWLVVALQVGGVHADESFVVSDIRVEGLQRISAASVFASLPVNVGDTVSPDTVKNAIRSLFRTGNFDNLAMSRDGSILVVTVQERPSISEINIEGNKAIKTEALLDGLKRSGLSEGMVFKRSTLEGMRMELVRQYVSQGRYDARIDTDVVSLPRNRVEVDININEGTPAAIKHINIVGNSVYSDDELLDLFELKTTGWFSWLTSSDKYAKEKLSGDLDTLKSYYLNSGYIKFNINSTQVSVTPDRDAVYITVNISEGDKYQVGEISLSGDLVLTEKELNPFVFVHSGETFSQLRVTDTEEWMAKRLGNDGYNFAKVQGIPSINDETKTVDIKFFVDPGKRTYVRRISYDGNVRTADEVLRQEMRQMESAPASTAAIENSRVRLERLGYFKEAKVDTVEVPGTDDLIDLVYTVEEQPSGSIGASVGFSQDSGFLFGANIQQDNFLGSGKQIGIGLNKSDYLTTVNFNYVNPYFTKDGVSRGFSVYYRKADLSEVNVANYTTDTIGGSLNFGYPLSEISKLGFSFGYAKTDITAGEGAVQEIVNSPRPVDGIDSYIPVSQLNDQGWYLLEETISSPVTEDLYYQTQDDFAQLGITEPGFLDENGDSFNNFTITTSWGQSTLNRGRLATRGASQSVALEITVPGSDVEYFKLTYNGQLFVPLTDTFTLRFRTELGYGDGFSGEGLPFFENFFSGGFGSVRGYKSNTLGPRSTPAYYYNRRGAALDVVNAGEAPYCNEPSDSTLAIGEKCSSGYYVGQAITKDTELSYVYDPTTGKLEIFPYQTEGDPFGGNMLVEGSVELLFPFPFVKDQRSLRSVFFIDAGNVFSSYCRPTQANCYDFNLNELRYSYGVGVSWITGFGPLTFSYGRPINESQIDETEAFQFSLGRSF